MFKLITTIIIIIIVLVLESSCMVMKDAEIFVIDFPEIRKRTLEQFKNVAGKLLLGCYNFIIMVSVESLWYRNMPLPNYFTVVEELNINLS